MVASGCASFTSPPTGTQLAPNGPVTITSNICLFSFLPGYESYFDDGWTYGDGPFANTPPNCDNTYQPAISEFDEGGQLLLAYMVPDGSKAGAVTSPELPGVTFTESSDYETWLQEADPANTGYQWVGYMSSPFTVSSSLSLQATAEFTPPASPAGRPNSTPYGVDSVVVGDRMNSSSGYGYDPEPDVSPDASSDVSSSDYPPTYPPGDTIPAFSNPSSLPLDCDGYFAEDDGVSSSAAFTSNSADTSADDDNASEFDTDCVEDYTSNPTDITTRSLTATAPSAAITVQAGNTATIPFTVEYNGPSADPFILSGSTSTSSLTATPSSYSFTPSGTGNTVEDVTVPVPAGLTPGNYTVTLNVGAFASTPATLTVTAAPASGTGTTSSSSSPVTPQQTPTISGLSLTNSSLKLTLKLNVAATEKLTLSRREKGAFKTLKTVSVKGSAGANTIKLGSVFGSLLKPAGRYKIAVQAVDGSLSSAVQSLTFVVS